MDEPIDWSSRAGAGRPEADLSEAERMRARADEAQVRKGFWRKLKRTIAHIPFATEAVASYYAAFDRETPLRTRATLLGALAYFVLPLDGIPDVLPLIGFTDDAAVLLLAYRALSAHITPAHMEAARAAIQEARAEAGADDARPRDADAGGRSRASRP